jgi:hypothetical protein
MTMPIEDLAISRVKIVDDNNIARKSLALILDDMDWEPIDEPGPLPNLDEFINASVKSVDAIICDHKLTTYAKFSGAQAVAMFYQRKFPALLCTAWNRADIDAMRVYRRFIPVVISPGDANPETIVDGFKFCKKELAGEFSSTRKPWRTLIRVVELNHETKSLYIVLPFWNSTEVIRLPMELIPISLQARLEPGFRFHAKVNLGSDDQNDLYFEDFELNGGN